MASLVISQYIPLCTERRRGEQLLLSFLIPGSLLAKTMERAHSPDDLDRIYTHNMALGVAFPEDAHGFYRPPYTCKPEQEITE